MRNGNNASSNIVIGLILLIVAVLLLSPVSAGTTTVAPPQEWNKTFDNMGNDYVYSVQQTSDGGYVSAGITGVVTSPDAWLIRTDSSGNKNWSKTFGAKGSDYASDVKQTSDGGYILAGRTGSYGAGGSDAWLIKTDNNGKEKWNKTFGGIENDYAYSVHQTSDGGYILSGSTGSSIPYDAWLIKTNSTGDQEWIKKFDDYSTFTATYSIQTSDGGYILAGTSGLYGSFNSWLIKMDSDGDQEWIKTFISDHGDEVLSVQQTSDDGYILAGCRILDAYSNSLIIKTDSSGNEQWNRLFNVTNSGVYSVQQTSDGGYVLAVSSRNYVNYYLPILDPRIIKTNSSGIQEWNKTLTGNDDDSTDDRIDDMVYSVQQTSDGGYVLGGMIESPGSIDAWLIKIAPDTVQPVDNPPVLATIGNKTIVENALLEFKISATDIDGDIVTYSATGLPDGATLDKNTGLFKWTPGIGTTGSYTVIFIATANGLTDSETVTISLNDWNPWNDLDSKGGESITLSELQEAIYDWRFGITLSTGAIVDLTRLQGLIYSWRFG